VVTDIITYVTQKRKKVDKNISQFHWSHFYYNQIALQYITITFVFINSISLFLLYIYRHCCDNNENFIMINEYIYIYIYIYIYCDNFAIYVLSIIIFFKRSISLVIRKKVFNCHIILGSVLSNSFKYRSLRSLSCIADVANVSFKGTCLDVCFRCEGDK